MQLPLLHSKYLHLICNSFLQYTYGRKGVPHCCIVSKRLKADTCPAAKPRCDLRRHKGSLRRTTISAGDYCNASLDVCENGYDCIDGICEIRGRRTVRAGEVCRYDDICENGYDCINDVCRLSRRTIRAGGVCRYNDVCENGYECVNEICQSWRRPSSRTIRAGGVCQIGGTLCMNGYSCIGGRCVIPMGAVCRYGDVCADGYSCIDGYCGVRRRSCSPATHAGGDCTNTRCCVPGYECQPSRLNGSDRFMCYGGASVQATTE